MIASTSISGVGATNGSGRAAGWGSTATGGTGRSTGETMTVDGARYAVYGPITYDASIDANLSLQAEIARTQFGTTTLDLRVNNLFDTIRNNNSTSTSQPYQLGRNLWVSLKYKY